MHIGIKLKDSRQLIPTKAIAIDFASDDEWLILIDEDEEDVGRFRRSEVQRIQIS